MESDEEFVHMIIACSINTGSVQIESQKHQSTKDR